MNSSKRPKEIVKDYFRELSALYSFPTLLTIAMLISIALIAIDCYNFPTQIIAVVPSPMLYIVTLCFVAIFVLWCIGLHIGNLFRIMSANVLDAVSFIQFVSLLIYCLAQFSFCEFHIFKFTVSLVLILISVVFVLVKLIRRSLFHSSNSEQQSNLLDLKDIFTNNFSYTRRHPILLSEQDVEYDLLSRAGIINQLYSSITHAQPQKSYVISIEGAWGCGKTTIINNVKKLLAEAHHADDYVVIDNFDPWLYGSQESLLLGMYDTLLQHLGIRYSSLRSHNMITNLSKTISERNIAGGIVHNLSIIRNNQSDAVEKAKTRISSLLRFSGKRVVFFIDNLDRATESNVIFLFKLINLVFDLPGIIYVLSFERERINTILKNTHEFDGRFVEKIIQQEIYVPSIARELLSNVYAECISNILIAYGIPADNFPRFSDCFQAILDLTPDIRSFKRLINSVFASVFCDDNGLYKPDLLAIEIVRFLSPGLYEQIYINSRFFVAYDLAQIDQLDVTASKERFNNEGKEFFAELFRQYPEYKDLLGALFPYVSQYNRSYDLAVQHLRSDPEYIDVSRNSRICSGKYFDLYFSYGSNSYLRTRQGIEALIEGINSAKDSDEISSLLNEKLLTQKDHKEWFEQFQNYLDAVSESQLAASACAIFDRINAIDNSLTFGGLSAKVRATYLTSVLLLRCSTQGFAEFLERIRYRFDNMYTISSLVHWLERPDERKPDDIDKRIEMLKNVHKEMCLQIVDEGINVYADPYYSENNIWGIYHYLRDAGDESRVADYIASLISSDNVYRILWDCVQKAVGGKYSYYIESKNISLLIADTEKLDCIIDRTPPKTDSEQFVYDIYKIYKAGEPDVWGEKTKTTAHEFKPQL